MTTFWIALGMLCVVSRGAHPRLLLLAGLAFGLASLTKNFLGLPAAGLVGIHLFATRRTSPRISPRLICAAVATLLAVSLTWPAAMLIVHGRAFSDVFLLRENLGRFRLGGHIPQAWKIPLPLAGRVGVLARTLFDGFFPWSLLAPLMVPWALRRLPEWTHDDRALTAGWVGLYAAGMLATTNPSAWYGYPFYPAVAILIGAFVQELLPDGRHGALLTALAGVLAAAAICFRPRWNGDEISFGHYRGLSVGIATARTSLFLAFAAAAALACVILLRPRAGRAILVFGLAAVSTAFGIAPLRAAPQVSSSKLLAKRIEAVAPAYGDAVTFWNVPFLARRGVFGGVLCEARWYLLGIHGATILNLADEAALPESLVRPRQPTLVLTQEGALGGLPPHRSEGDTLIWNARVALAGIREDREH